MKQPLFYGYVRSHGDVGIRNHVLLITAEMEYVPLVDMISRIVPQAKKIIPSYTEKADEFAYHNTIEVMVKLCQNPNVGAALWIGSEELCDFIQSKIQTGSTIRFIQVSRINSRIDKLEDAIESLAELIRMASHQRREPCPIRSLRIALECGGSDYSSGVFTNPAVGKVVDSIINFGGAAVFSETAEIIGAEHILVKRAKDDNTRNRLLELVDKMEERMLKQGINIRQSNPTNENKAGGLTTLEEKSLGAISKSGTSAITKVLDYGELIEQPGLYFMDTPSFAPESITGMAAGGCQLCLFTTGVGNPYGDLILPTIKVSARPSTNKALYQHIDIPLNPDEPAKFEQIIVERVLEVCSGMLTRSEAWGEEGVCIPWRER